jgi:monovalent cation:H+ antiporter-2, CPA2 family
MEAMGNSAGLATVLLLLAAVIVVVVLVRRLHLPPIIGYLAAGAALGPHGFGLARDSQATHELSEIGVTFLLFTLGLEFSLPRLLARRREVFGLGSLQVTATTLAAAAIARAAGADWPVALVIGGSIAMSSTALVLQQLAEQVELNRTHGRLAFSMLLFQDLAFVVFLALATALPGTELMSAGEFAAPLGKAVLALLLVLIAGRYLARPLFFEITRGGNRELFTLAVLFVALGSAFLTRAAGLSLALGGCLAGMLLAETEYRHQINAVIRPFRDVLLGLFFVSVGMLLDLSAVEQDAGIVALLVVGMLIGKAVIASVAARGFCDDLFKALRAGLVICGGGEFGFALITVLIQNRAAAGIRLDPLLAAIVLTMLLSPFVIRHNKAIARLVLRQSGPDPTALAREAASHQALAARVHVVLCGYGRVGQRIARVLEREGYEFIAVDADPSRVRAARQAGEPVLYGDAANEDVLRALGIEHASAVVVSFADPARSLPILSSVRRLCPGLPVLVRTQDDARLVELQQAGATEVVPETLEASLTLLQHLLLVLGTPMAKVLRTVEDIRGARYAALRGAYPREDPKSDPDTPREELRSVLLPPGAWAVGRSLAEVRAQGAQVSFTALRRAGIVGRDPEADTVLREGDILVVLGLPAALERAEGILLAG